MHFCEKFKQLDARHGARRTRDTGQRHAISNPYARFLHSVPSRR
jgi:hypothetical protein